MECHYMVRHIEGRCLQKMFHSKVQNTLNTRNEDARNTLNALITRYKRVLRVKKGDLHGSLRIKRNW